MNVIDLRAGGGVRNVQLVVDPEAVASTRLAAGLGTNQPSD